MCEYLSCKLLCVEKSIESYTLWHDQQFVILRVIHSSLEHVCWDPKDGELCLCRMKPGETLVEVRSDTDVQIVRLT